MILTHKELYANAIYAESQYPLNLFTALNVDLIYVKNVCKTTKTLKIKSVHKITRSILSHFHNKSSVRVINVNLIRQRKDIHI